MDIVYIIGQDQIIQGAFSETLSKISPQSPICPSNTSVNLWYFIYLNYLLYCLLSSISLKAL